MTKASLERLDEASTIEPEAESAIDCDGATEAASAEIPQGTEPDELDRAALDQVSNGSTMGTHGSPWQAHRGAGRRRAAGPYRALASPSPVIPPARLPVPRRRA